MIQNLVENGPDSIYVKTKNALLPIHVACLNNPSIEVIQILLDTDRVRQTLMAPSKHLGLLPLHCACSNEKTTLDVILALIKANDEAGDQGQAKRPSLIYRTKLGWTPLHTCIASNQEHEIIEAVLKASDNDYSINTSYPVLFERVNGLLPLQLACLKGASVETVKLLMNSDPSRKTFYDIITSCEEYELRNSTILHVALANSSTEVINLLLLKEVKARCRISPNVRNLHNIQEGKNGMMPMHVACAREELDAGIIQTLLQLRRKSVFDCDDAGNTPLHIVCMNSSVSEDIIDMLLESEKTQNVNEQLMKSNKHLVESDVVFEDNPFWRRRNAEKRVVSAARTTNSDGHSPLFLATHAGATEVHRLLGPEYLLLAGLGSEEQERLFDILLKNPKMPLEIVNNLAQFQYFVFIMLELVLNVLTTVTFFIVSSSVFNDTGSVQLWHIIVLAFCILFFSLREFIQFMGSSTSADYFFDGWNMVELSSLSFLILNLYQLIEYWIHEIGSIEVNADFFMISGTLLILQFILIVRTSFLPFARFVAGLISILAELIPFTIVSTMFLV